MKLTSEDLKVLEDLLKSRKQQYMKMKSLGAHSAKQKLYQEQIITLIKVLNK